MRRLSGARAPLRAGVEKSESRIQNPEAKKNVI